MLNKGIFILACVLLSQDVFAQSGWDRVPDKVKGRNAFKRHEWFYRQRALPYDTIPYDALDKAMKAEKIRYRESRDGQVWTPVGPAGIVSTYPSQWGVVSGRVRAIAVHPSDPQTVYAGVSSGGLWKSTDGGDSWIDVGANLPSMTYGAVEIDPHNPNVVYAGSGEWMRYFNLNTYDGKGMYKSTDGGSAWTEITNGFGSRTHFSSIRVSPYNPDVVFATLGSGYWLYANPGNEGVWRSSDAGVTWSRTLNVDDAFEVIPHPAVPNRVFACIGGGQSGSGLYVSVNDGISFSLNTSGIPYSASVDRMHLAIVKDEPAVMYSLIYNGTSDSIWLYKSVDTGSTWFPTPARYSSGQGWYDLLLGVNPGNSNEVYIGDAELRRSVDGGQTFSYVGGSYWSQSMHVDFHVMKYSLSDTSVRYIGCDGGLYRSVDAGSSWHHRNSGLTTLQYYRISSHPTNPDIIIGGAQDNGLYRTTNGGTGTWDLISTGDGMESFFNYSNGNIVYASTQYGAFKRSNTGGSYGTFSNISFSASGQSFAWTAPFFMHPKVNTTLFAAAFRPYKSTNSGSSWFPLTTSNLTTAAIISFDVSPANPDYMIIGGAQWQTTPPVFVSTNGGSQWTTVTANIPGAARYITRVVCHPQNAATMYVVRSGFGSGKIYRTTNAGANWLDISSNLPDVPHNDLFIDPEIPEVMYTANDLGVYVTTNSGASWTRENGIPWVPAIDFSYVKIGSSRILRAATHGRSAFQSYLPRNQAPFVTQSIPDTALLEDFSKTFCRKLSYAFSDSDGSSLTYSVQAVLPGVSPVVSGDSLYLTSVENYFGQASVRVTASDGSLSVSDTFAVTVANVNDSPLTPVIIYPANNDTFYTDTLSVLWNKSYDADHDPVSYIWGLTGENISTEGSTSDTVVSISGNYVTGSPYIFTVRASDGTDTTEINTRTFYRGHLIGISDPLVTVPKEIVLLQNYPNPFNPVTTVRFGVPSVLNVKITIYNIFGQKVKTIANRSFGPGYHSAEWDSRDEKNSAVSSGVYLYRLETQNGAMVRKMLLLK